MKIGIKVIASLWAILMLLIGINIYLDSPEQIEKDKAFINIKIKPSVDFINNFKSQNKRLPTYREFYTWQREYYKDYNADLTQEIDSLIPGLGSVHYIKKKSDIIDSDQYKFKDADWANDFAVGVWRGEWEEYYYSWNNSYEGNNYSNQDGIMGLIITTALGIIPLLLLYHNSRKRKSST